MKKDILALSLLLLLFCATLLNIMYLDRFVNGLVSEINSSQELLEKGDYAGAEEKLRNVIELWNDAGGYTRIVVRHSEIDSTADAFFELLSDIVSRDDKRSVGSYSKVRSHLRGIASMEYITLGSIF